MESYFDQYNRLKGTGVKPAVRFFRPGYMSMQEEYKPITNLHVEEIEPDRYYISNFGNIFDKHKGKYKTLYDRDGYKTCYFKYKEIKVHRLVLLVFDYRPDHAKLLVNHIDGDPSNNKLWNLEWTTQKENTAHAMLFGLHVMNNINNPNNKLTINQVHEICKLIEEGNYYDTEIAKMYNVSYTNISDIHKGKIWTEISKQYNLNVKKPRKFTESDIIEICKLLESGQYFTTEIAKMYNTNHSTICAIRDGKVWVNISKKYNMTKRKSRKSK